MSFRAVLGNIVGALLLCLASSSVWAAGPYKGLNYDVYVKYVSTDTSGCFYSLGETRKYHLYLKPRPKITVLDSKLPLGIQNYPLEPILEGEVGYHSPLCSVDPQPVVDCKAITNLAETTALSEATLATYTRLNSVNGDWNGDGLDDLFANGHASINGFGCPIQIKNNGVTTLPSFSIPTSADVASSIELANATTLLARNIDGSVGEELIVRMSGQAAVPAVSVKADSNGKLFTSNSLVEAYVPDPDLGDGFIDPSSILPKVVGATAGSHSVGVDGSASYSIPLALPVGAGGIQPSLSFQYNSSSGNGNMGFGWQMNAISRIHRCGKSAKQDGEFTTVEFVAGEDQLCLDGQRLVLKDGAHGENGAEYRLENEVFIKVIAVNGEESEMPDSFTVYGPDGSVMSYSTAVATNSDDMNAPSYNKVLEWLLSSTRDRWGNHRDYVYDIHEDDGYYTLDRIDYGGNLSGTPTEHTHRVQFRYGSRGNGYYGYMHGSLLSNPKVLTSVEIYENGLNEDSLKLRFYAMKYDIATHNRVIYLKAITECSGTNVCLYPTRFEWEEPGTGFDAPADIWLSEGSRNFSSNAYGFHEHWADMNGDGRTDRVWKPGNKNSLWVALANSSGTGFETETEWRTEYNGIHVTSYNGTREVLADANGDGLPDYIWQPDDDDNNIHVALNTGSSLQTPTIWRTGTNSPKLYYAENNGAYEAFIDMNNDGFIDKAWRANGGDNYYVSLNDGSSFGTPAPWYTSPGTPKSYSYEGKRETFVDVTGDGLPDKVWIPATGGGSSNSGDIYVAKNIGTGFDTEEKWLSEDDMDVEILSNDAKWEGYTDLNGDGLADRYWIPKNLVPKAFYVALSDGTKFLPPTTWLRDYSSASIDIHSKGGRSEFFMDVNDDGYVDRVWRPENDRQSLFVALSTGSGFMEPYEWLSQTTAGKKVSSNNDSHEWFIDLNGDGLPDRVWMPDDDGNKLRVSLNLAKPSSELVKITNGFGHEIHFDYAPLTDSSVYSKHAGLTVTYPLNSNKKPFVQDARRVVKQVEFSDGLGGFAGTGYDYEGLRYGIENKESLGFARIKATNLVTGMYDITTYNQGDVTPKLTAQSSATDAQGLIAVTETHSGGGSDVVLSQTVNTWGVDASGSGLVISGNKRFTRKLLTTDITKRGLDGHVLYIENNSYTYDSDGRINVQTTVSKDPAGTTLKTTTIDNDYVNFDDENNAENFTDDLWIIGQTEKITVTDDVTAAAYPDSYNPAAVTRVSKWEYSATGVLEAEQIWNGAETVMLSETAYSNYDPFGHPLTVTVSGADFTSREVTSAYDDSGRFVIDTINALDQHVCAEYFTATDGFSNGAYPGLAKYTSTLSEDCDENIGIKTSYQYDSFGRVTTTTAASNTDDPVSTTTSFMTCTELNYAANCPNGYVAYAIKTVTEGSGDAWSYVDVLGREIQRKAQGFDGSWVMVDKIYNDKGQLEQSTEPYFYGDTPQYNSYEYDLRDRVIEVTQADGRVDTQSYSGNFNSTTKVTATETVTRDVGSSPHKNESRTEKKNALGQVIAVVDNASNMVEYRYDSAGRLVKTIDSDSNEVTLTYDEFGRKTGMSDPDKGTWSYGYNGLGQLVLQTNAKGDKTCIVYDLLGRMTQRVDQYREGETSNNLANALDDCANPGGSAVIAHWEYDHVETGNNGGLGKLYRTYSGSSFSTSTEYREERLYDTMGRLVTVNKTIKTADYSYSTTYTDESRPDTITYPKPSGAMGDALEVEYQYHASLGYLTHIRNAANDDLFYQIDEMNARGQITQETFGNGVESVRAYDASGRIDTILTSKSGAGYDIQDIDVDFDLIGNLTSRADAAQGFEESFTYDNLNRLTGASADFGNSDVRTLTVTYDTLGNITSKNGIGDYKYGSDCTSVTINSVTGVAAGPHAVCAITSTGLKNTLYTYDANGNMLTGDGRTITYASFDLPTQIVKGSATSTIAYGPDRNRYWREDVVTGSPTVTTTTEQVDGLYERVTHSNADTEEKHYLGNFAVVTITDRDSSSAGTTTTRYLHTDHLGSLTAITNESGALVELHNYDAWGERRSLNADTMNTLLGSTLWGNLTGLQTISGATTKGYTGHEMFDDVGIIHMNGRIYDPVIARFLQADPIIQDTTDLQAFNRYSYVQNRPLSLTDPSGFISLGDDFDKIKEVVKYTNPTGYIGASMLNEVRKSITREVGRVFIRVPELQAVATAVAFYFGGPLGAAYVNALITSIVTYQSGGNFSDIMRNGATAFATTYAVASVGAGVGAAHGIVAGTAASTALAGAISKAQGGKFFDAKSFVTGFLIGAATGYVLDSMGYQSYMKSGLVDGAGKAAADVSGCSYGVDATCGGGRYVLQETNIEDGSGGFQWGRYSNVQGGPDLVGIGGTQFQWGDLFTDIANAFGFRTAQYDAAAALGREFGTGVIYTGHSLGGGLAATAANAAGPGAIAITFNAAGPAWRYRGGGANITNYHNGTDIVTLLQRGTFIPDALGRQIALPNTGWHQMNGVNSGINSCAYCR